MGGCGRCHPLFPSFVPTVAETEVKKAGVKVKKAEVKVKKVPEVGVR